MKCDAHASEDGLLAFTGGLVLTGDFEGGHLSFFGPAEVASRLVRTYFIEVILAQVVQHVEFRVESTELPVRIGPKLRP